MTTSDNIAANTLNKSMIPLKHNCLVMHGLSTSDTQYLTNHITHNRVTHIADSFCSAVLLI